MVFANQQNPSITYTAPGTHQIIQKTATAQNLPSDVSPAGLERLVPRQTVGKRRHKEGTQKNAHSGSRSTLESLQQNDGAKEPRQLPAENFEAAPRASSSLRLRSSLDERRRGEARGGGRGSTTTAAGPATGGNIATRNKSKERTTPAVPRQHQQGHQRIGDPGRDKHLRPATDPGRPQPVEESPTSSSAESSRFSSESPSVWDVGRSLAGLADVDVVSTMNGLLEREVRKSQPGAPKVLRPLQCESILLRIYFQRCIA